MEVIMSLSNIAYSQPKAATDFADLTKQWIDWQLNQYFSLATYTSVSDSQSKYRGGQRHWWKSLADYWLNKPPTEASDDIIVQFANDEVLCQSLRTVAKNPTTQLTSIRRKIRAGKPLEMDATCLRDLEQKPGKNLLDKAMGVPRILSLHRTHNYSTLENRIFLYVIASLIDRAKSYLNNNQEFGHSRRVQSVKKLLSNLNEITAQTRHFNCVILQPSLSILPNNCLLYDRHYNIVWITFRRLLLIEQATQEAVLYQHTLWKETGRQLLGSLLCSRLPKCRSLAGSCAYIKRDMQEGRWTEQSSFPGPFQWQRYHLSFIDTWDPEPDSFGTKILNDLNADQLLVANLKGFPSKQIAIWYHHCPFDKPFEINKFMENSYDNLEIISKAMGIKVDGLIIGSAPLGSLISFCKFQNVIYLTVPADFSTQLEDIIAAVQDAMEYFLEIQ